MEGPYFALEMAAVFAIMKKDQMSIQKGADCLKKAAGVMLGMFALMIWPFGGIWEAILKPLIGGGPEQSFLYPLYIGVILLSGLVVGCTTLIITEIQSFRHERKKEE